MQDADFRRETGDFPPLRDVTRRNVEASEYWDDATPGARRR